MNVSPDRPEREPYSYKLDPKMKNNLDPRMKIKCISCKKLKTPQNFHKQLVDELRKKMSKEDSTSFDPAKDQRITCMYCAPRELVELKCVDCATWFGLDRFSKQQRKKPDAATCTVCTEGILSTDASGAGDEMLNVESESEDDLADDYSESGVTFADTE